VKIAVNTRLLLPNRLDGMGWFAAQSLKRITAAHPEVHFIYLFDRDFDEQFITSDNITPLILSPQARHPILYYLWFQWSVKQTLNRLKPDLFLSPDGFLSLGAETKQLPVIHDINFHYYPEQFNWLAAKYYNYYFPRFAQTATRVATVSEYSKQDISKVYHVLQDKIDVVYNGINEFYAPIDATQKLATKQKWTHGEDYFLFVGALSPRKNILRLVKAFLQFKKNGSKHKLVLVGPEFWGNDDLKKEINNSNHKSDIIFTGRLNDEELKLVTGAALALTYIPLFEGFGIPIIEAMQAEIPIISGKATSLPEVAGDAVLFVNHDNIEDIALAMKRISEEPTLREQLIIKGKSQREKFSWDKTATRLWQSVEKTISV
jgi:glycosyltransferase involved in cell wall biosynthesis